MVCLGGLGPIRSLFSSLLPLLNGVFSMVKPFWSRNFFSGISIDSGNVCASKRET